MTPTDQVQVLLGPSNADLCEILQRLTALPPWRPFDQRLIDFAARLSNQLLTSPRVREFPELAALGHWFRKARLVDIARSRVVERNDLLRLGRGLAFHVAPANVDSVFMYSWLLSLLAGNTNIVRVSQTASPQQQFLIELLEQLCGETDLADVAARIVILTYPHQRELTQQISEQCAVRLVWGGDGTVNEIRSIPLRPTATELCFPDRFSLAALHAKSVSKIDDKAFADLINGFYNDTFWFGQQACSSPRMVAWVGSGRDIESARGRFWPALVSEVRRRDAENSAGMLMARLGAVFECAADASAEVSISTDLAAFPLILDADDADLQVIREIHCGNGLFFQTSITSLADLAPHLTDQDQTMAVFGFRAEDINEFISRLPARAIDRITPVGKALDFDTVWDGQDFFLSLTRCLIIR